MAMQIENSSDQIVRSETGGSLENRDRNSVEDSPSVNREEGLVKRLVRGLVRSGGIYANARMAADQESDAEKRDMHALTAERAKSALLDDIAAANEYIETLKQKIEEARNESTAAVDEEDEASPQTEDVEEAVLEQEEETEETEVNEADEITDVAVEEDTSESEDESVPVSEEAGTDEAEAIEDVAAETEETEIDEAEDVAEMFGLAKGTAEAISELLFSGPRNPIEPNEKLTQRNIEKIALVLDAIGIDEAEVRDRTRAFLLHKGFEDEAIIEETVEAVINLWRQYQQEDDNAPEDV